MNCKPLLSVVILLICTNIRAAAPLTNSTWLALNDDKSLVRYRQTLLSEDVFPFLKTCYNQSCCDENDNKRCSLYFDAVLWANETNLTPATTNESTIVAQTKQNEFCKELSIGLSNMQKFRPTSLYQNQTESFKSFVSCVIDCFYKDTGKVRPACSISSWLLNQNFKAMKSSIVLDKNEKGTGTQLVKSQNSESVTPKPEPTPAAPAQLQEIKTITNVSNISSTTPANVPKKNSPLDLNDVELPESLQNETQAPVQNNSPELDTDVMEEVYRADQEQGIETKKANGNAKSDESVVVDPFIEETSSNFFAYFLFGMFSCILLYVIYNNKSKILALILEGRRSQGGRNGRRKHTAAYRKLDTNLEEAITSSTTSGRTSQIIY